MRYEKLDDIEYKGYKISVYLEYNKNILYEFKIGNCGTYVSENLNEVQEKIDKYIISQQMEVLLYYPILI